MTRTKRFIGALLAVIASASAAGAQAGSGADHAGAHSHALPATLDEWARGAQLFEGLGPFHRRITTGSKRAQLFFDQGMRFLWAFNHDEATRSFARAAQLDPRCASCYWGVALTLGPNYNMPVMPGPRAKVGWDALAKAQQYARRASPVERALIDAVARRYLGAQPLDPANSAPLITAYAAAMKDVAARFPADLDVQTLYAEALMNANPWKLWNADGSPAPGTGAIVATLEAVLAADPAHPGANHYYVHAVEASPHPDKALRSAERLKTLMPAAGHMVHMPAHILERVGRYGESAAANRAAAAADLAYYGKTAPVDYYPMYSAHNYQFLAAAAAMEGRRAETIAALREARKLVSDDMLAQMPGQDWTIAYLYEAMVRFGMWDALIAEPAPNPAFRALAIGYASARATALAAIGRVAEAKAASQSLDAMIAAAPADSGAGMNPAKDLFAIAALKAKARIAQAERRPDDAIVLLREAVAGEDRLAYNEPSDEFFPVRHLLGAALLGAGRPVEAELVYREDLNRNPANGWALLGLARALEAQQKRDEAATVRAHFADAWKQADVTIETSAF